jgi:hypothetical protein
VGAELVFAVTSWVLCRAAAEVARALREEQDREYAVALAEDRAREAQAGSRWASCRMCLFEPQWLQQPKWQRHAAAGRTATEGRSTAACCTGRRCRCNAVSKAASGPVGCCLLFASLTLLRDRAALARLNASRQADAGNS